MPDLRTEAEVEKWLAAKLGWEKVPALLWQRLVEYGFVRDVIDSVDPEAQEALLAEARSLKALTRSAVAAKRRKHKHDELALHEFYRHEEVVRANVYSNYLARQSATDAAVVRFRAENLGGSTLSAAQAEAFLAQPAPYFLSRDEFERQSVSVVAHRARCRPSPRTLRGGGHSHVFELVLEREGGEARYQFVVPSDELVSKGLDLPWDMATRIERFPVRDGSVFDKLHHASSWLAGHLPWHRWDALWFILTGAVPFVHPVQVGSKGLVRGGLRLTFEVDAWVSAKTMTRIYVAWQRKFLLHENRPITAKQLELFDFVMWRRTEDGSGPLWADLMRQWNAAHPSSPYSAYRSFRRDYLRVREAVTRPRYAPQYQTLL